MLLTLVHQTFQIHCVHVSPASPFRLFSHVIVSFNNTQVSSFAGVYDDKFVQCASPETICTISRYTVRHKISAYHASIMNCHGHAFTIKIRTQSPGNRDGVARRLLEIRIIINMVVEALRIPGAAPKPCRGGSYDTRG